MGHQYNPRSLQILSWASLVGSCQLRRAEREQTVHMALVGVLSWRFSNITENFIMRSLCTYEYILTQEVSEEPARRCRFARMAKVPTAEIRLGSWRQLTSGINCSKCSKPELFWMLKSKVPRQAEGNKDPQHAGHPLLGVVVWRGFWGTSASPSGPGEAAYVEAALLQNKAPSPTPVQLLGFFPAFSFLCCLIVKC